MDLVLPDDFKEFLRLLTLHQVEYMMIGGYAVSFHGYPRATMDLDIWVGMTPENADRLQQVLIDFGFAVPALNKNLFLVQDKIIRMGTPPLRIEILTTISGVFFEDCFPNRIQGVVDGVPTNLISLQDLKTNKRASGRHKDLSDLEYLP
jgi:hypothetical protein